MRTILIGLGLIVLCAVGFFYNRGQFIKYKDEAYVHNVHATVVEKYIVGSRFIVVYKTENGKYIDQNREPAYYTSINKGDNVILEKVHKEDLGQNVEHPVFWNFMFMMTCFILGLIFIWGLISYIRNISCYL